MRETERIKGLIDDGTTVIVLNFGKPIGEPTPKERPDKRVKEPSYRLSDGRRVRPVGEDGSTFTIIETGQLIRKIA